MNILVTGGAGYIGSHAVLALTEAGHDVVILDSLVYGHRDIVAKWPRTRLVVGDIGDRVLLERLLRETPFDAAMHFCAYAYVGESVSDPSKYWRNNVASTLTLLEALVAVDVKRFVFSSTCATYGVPTAIPIVESHPQNPINPYGMTKLVVEKMLADFDAAYGLKSTVFRYFNAAGADPKGRAGEDHDPETHLIPLAIDVATGRRPSLAIFGTDYPTPDGTCVRDYVHVSDLADAHVLGLEFLLRENRSDAFNLGNGDGHSVRRIVQAVERASGRKIATVDHPRRAGDPPALVGSAEKARRTLGWKPRFADIDTIVGHAWEWHRRRFAAK